MDNNLPDNPQQPPAQTVPPEPPHPLLQSQPPVDPFDQVAPLNPLSTTSLPPSPSSAPMPSQPDTQNQSPVIEPETPMPPPPEETKLTPVFNGPSGAKKGFSKFLILMLVLIIMAGAGSAYYLMNSKTPKPTEPIKTPAKAPISTPTEIPSVTVAPSQTSTPTPTITDTSIKNYKNSQYGYSLDYPSTWTFKENTNQYGSVRFTDPNKQIPGGSPIGDISMTVYKSALNLDKWVESGHPFFGTNLKSYYSTDQNTTINGYPVILMSGGTDATYGKVAYIKDGGYVYELFLQGTVTSLKSNNMLNLQVFNQMLNSFKSNSAPSQ